MIDGELRRGTANDRWLCVGVDISEEMVCLAYTYPCRKETEYVQAAEFRYHHGVSVAATRALSPSYSPNQRP